MIRLSWRFVSGPVVTRLRSWLAVLLFSGTAVGGCKRADTLPPVEFTDELEAPIEDSSQLAPAWQVPAKAMLDNKVELLWMTEAGRSTSHIRLFLPTTDSNAESYSADVLLVAMGAFESDLGRRVARWEGKVEVVSLPGRIEVALHGPAKYEAAMLTSLGYVLRPKTVARTLAQGQGQAMRRYRPPQPETTVGAHLISKLGDGPVSEQLASVEGIRGMDSEKMLSDWSRLTAPERAVLVVHSPRPATQGATGVQRLVKRWTSESKTTPSRSSKEESVPRSRLQGLQARLSSQSKTRLRARPQAQLLQVHSTGNAVDDGTTTGSVNHPTVVFGRLVATPTFEDRVALRLAQRMLQEKLDARVVQSGAQALFVVRVPIRSREPQKSLASVLDYLAKFAKDPQPLSRLRQAADIWLGARVVDASLSGEDWTALWSESIDLWSPKEGEADESGIARAIDAEAKTMLAMEPAQVQAFVQKWLVPSGGEPGWEWAAIGADATMLEALSKLPDPTEE